MSATVESVLLTILTEQSELANKHIALLKTLPSLQTNVNILPQPVAQQMMQHLTSTSSSGGAFISNSNVPKPLKVGEFLGMSDTSADHQNAGASSPGSAPVNKAGKPKKEKDPNKPKKAPSAYLVFMQDKQAAVREQNKSLNQRELMQEMGRLWAALPETEKQRYGQTAEEEKNKYYDNMTAYNATRGLPPPPGAQKKEAKENAAAAAATATMVTGTSSSSSSATVTVPGDPSSFSPLPLSLPKQPSVKKAAAAMVPIPLGGSSGSNGYSLEANVTAILGDQALLPPSSNSLGISAEDAEKKKKKKEKRKNEEGGGNDDESEKKVKHRPVLPSPTLSLVMMELSIGSVIMW